MYIIILLSLKYIHLHLNVLIVYKLCFYVSIWGIFSDKKRDECILKWIDWVVFCIYKQIISDENK